MKKSSFAVRYLLSYLLVIILPVTGMVIYQYRTSIRAMEEKFGVTQSNAAIQVRNMLEMEMQRVPQIRTIISLDGSFSPVELENSNFANYTAIQRLKEFTLYSNVIRSVVIYSDKLPFLLTEAGSITKTYFGNTLFHFQRYDQTALFERIEALDEVEVTRENALIPNGVDGQYLVYWYPVKNYSSESTMALMIFVDIGQFESIIHGMQTEEVGCFAILDDQNRFILNVGNAGISAQEVLTAYEHDYVEGQPLKINKESYFVTCVSGDTTGWTYLYYTTYDQITAELRQLRHRLLWLMLVILCLSGGVLYLFLKINYMPLRKLEVKVRQELHLDEQKDELQTIQDGFRVLKQKIDWVNECMFQSRAALIRHGLEQLLEGNVPSGIYSGTIEVPKENWIVAVTPAMNEAWLEALRTDLHTQDTLCYYYLLVNQGMMVLFINATPAKIQEAVQKLRQIFDRHGLTAQLCISTVAQSVEEIPQRYAEVKAQLMQIPLMGSKHPEAAEKPSERKKAEGFLHELETAVRIGNVRQLSKLRLQISQYAYQELTLGRSLNCLLSLWQAVISNGLSHELRSLYLQRIEELSQQPTAEHFESVLSELILQTERTLYHEKNLEGSNLIVDQYKAYLEAHYLDEDFSITQMAEGMGISASHMSNTFKSAQGITMIEYVNKLKMKKAMEMIRTQDISVSELARRLRYQSTSSFIRAFKKITFMTPKQYADQIAASDTRKGRDIHDKV